MKNPKVGDRVAVYGRSVGDAGVVNGDGRVRCRVLAVGLDCNLIRVGEDFGDKGWSALVHPKQCRRLVRRERERIWVQRNPDGSYGPDVRKSPPAADDDGAKRVRTKPPGFTWREFVAVREKK